MTFPAGLFMVVAQNTYCSVGRAQRMLMNSLSTLVFGLVVFLASRTALAAENQACESCHDNPTMAGIRSSTGKSIYIEKDRFLTSAHRTKTCIECHEGFEPIPHRKRVDTLLCVKCHVSENKPGIPNLKERFESYKQSVHGRLARADFVSSNCALCHDEGDVDRLKTLPRPNACGRPAACSSCHSVHSIKAGDKNAAMLARELVPRTCGACHLKSLVQYASGVHGEDLMRGQNADVPTCTDCHGEHTISGSLDKASPTYVGNVVKLCGRCHDSPKLIEKYELPWALKSYEANFHGKAFKGGKIETANCVSCHRSHDILRASNPKSPVNEANLARTCSQSKCHPSASKEFYVRKFHTPTLPAKYASIGMMFIIIATVGGMISFISVENIRAFIRKKRIKRFKRQGGGNYGADIQTCNELEERIEAQKDMAEPILRFDLFIRIQHIIMMTTVFLLMFTGLPFKFLDSVWVSRVYRLFNMVDVNRDLHRIGGFGLGLVATLHVIYLIFTANGRRFFLDMLPRFRDFTDLLDTILYFVGRNPSPPKFAVFSYKEKFEYWAAAWGTTMMLMTGVVLWFYKIVGMQIFAGVGSFLLDTALVLHSYEATLEVLAIVIWHFYNAHLSPHHFPMNKVFLTGKMDFDGYFEEHRGHLEQLRMRGRLTPNQLARMADLEKLGRFEETFYLQTTENSI